MTFCTAHRPRRQPRPQADPAPLPRPERRRGAVPRIAADQIYTDWASI